MPATSVDSSKALFAFLLRPLTVLMRQTRQAVGAINQSIFRRCLWASLIIEGKGQDLTCKVNRAQSSTRSGNTKGGSVTVQLTSCLTGLESAV